MAKNEKSKTEKIEIRVTKDFKKKIKEKAKEADLTLSEYIIKLLEHSSVVILKDSAEFAKELALLRIALEENGLSKEDKRIIRSLIVKINELVESLPQNRSDLYEDVDYTVVDSSDEDDEDFEDEEWEEGGDLI